MCQRSDKERDDALANMKLTNKQSSEMKVEFDRQVKRIKILEKDSENLILEKKSSAKLKITLQQSIDKVAQDASSLKELKRKLNKTEGNVEEI